MARTKNAARRFFYGLAEFVVAIATDARVIGCNERQCAFEAAEGAMKNVLRIERCQPLCLKTVDAPRFLIFAHKYKLNRRCAPGRRPYLTACVP